MGSCSEPLKEKTTNKKRAEIREKYNIPIPNTALLYGPICRDYTKKYGLESEPSTEQLITYWRKNRDKYPAPLTREEQIQQRKKDDEERRQKAEAKKEAATKQRELDLIFNPLKVFPKNSWEEYFQSLEARRRGINLKEERKRAKEAEIAKEAQLEAMKALVAELPNKLNDGNEQVAKEAQLEAMKALVEDMPSGVKFEGAVKDNPNGPVFVDKGKRVVVDISDDDDDDHDD